jgi:hypothetical protein
MCKSCLVGSGLEASGVFSCGDRNSRVVRSNYAGVCVGGTFLQKDVAKTKHQFRPDNLQQSEASPTTRKLWERPLKNRQFFSLQTGQSISCWKVVKISENVAKNCENCSKNCQTFEQQKTLGKRKVCSRQWKSPLQASSYNIFKQHNFWSEIDVFYKFLLILHICSN